jgi:hypothetical protein
MTLILSGVHTLLQHLTLLSQTPECFRPKRCPHCRVGGLWSHRCYTREADRFGEGENRKHLNPIPIRSVHPELGREGDCRAFWRSGLAQWGLSNAMVYLSRQGVLVHGITPRTVVAAAKDHRPQT